jgi:periplasmic copper chaperone A
MTRRTALLAPLLLLAGCHARPAEPTVTQAWVRLPAVAGQPAAAYFTIHGGRQGKVLVRLESALAAKTEMHQSMRGMQGMTSMAPLAQLDVPAGQDVLFKPGGNHAMLIGLDPVVKPGTAVPIRFGFSDGTTAEAEAKSVGAGEDPPY